MTKAKFFKNESGHIVKYIVQDHAGYDESGSDIVCAAISILTQTGINALEEVCDIKTEYTARDGLLEVVLPENIETIKRHKADIVLETILTGLKSIREAYPDNITLEYGEV